MGLWSNALGGNVRLKVILTEKSVKTLPFLSKLNPSYQWIKLARFCLNAIQASPINWNRGTLNFPYLQNCLSSHNSSKN